MGCDVSGRTTTISKESDSSSVSAAFKSMSSSRMFPFDGSCALSKDADLKISFHDGTHLKTHSCLLSLASTILRTAIEECVHNSVLNVEHDNREAWILLLNVVHPSGPILLPNTAFPSIESLVSNASTF